MEEKILQSFLYKENQSFSEIEKSTKERSNKVSYHITKLTKKGIITKEKDSYSLSKETEKKIPYLNDSESPLVVILVAIKKNEDNIFLIKRKKRPFKGKLGLPGGRLHINESIEDATQRITKKWGVKATLQKVNSVSLEHTEFENEKVHSFLLILVSATTNDFLEYTNFTKNADKIISSDYNLIANSLDKKIEIGTYITSL